MFVLAFTDLSLQSWKINTVFNSRFLNYQNMNHVHKFSYDIPDLMKIIHEYCYS